MENRLGDGTQSWGWVDEKGRWVDLWSIQGGANYNQNTLYKTFQQLIKTLHVDNQVRNLYNFFKGSGANKTSGDN